MTGCAPEAAALQRRTLTRIYPVAPANADAWLAREIARAASDPGAVAVFRCWLPATKQ